jgi:DNA replication protein DnaC
MGKDISNDSPHIAMLDRVLHHSHVLQIIGDSYRIKEKKQTGLMETAIK